LINVDFNDVKSVMQGAGSALMGIGTAKGEHRAIRAAEIAVSNPLLEASIEGAHGVLLQIAGASDLGLHEIDEAARLVSEVVSKEANIIFGSTIDDTLGDEVRITVIAAGFDSGSPSYRKAERGVFAEPAAPAAAVAAPVLPSAPLASGLNAFLESEEAEPATAAIPVVESEPAKKPGSLWGDDLDLPNFLR
jgi:cell division protein FtsZ